MNAADARRILTCPMGENDADAATVGGYLVQLLLGVWHEGEGFDGKRPFGNSSWEDEVYSALVKNGHLREDFDYDDAEQIVADAILYFMEAVTA